MLRSIVGWVRLNGEDWSETMRRMNHRLNVALELFLIPPWTEQLAKHQFFLAAKIASEQSWLLDIGLADGSRRPKYLFGKMLGNSLFHILWASKPSFSPCSYGIVVLGFFSLTRAGAKAKKRWLGHLPTLIGHARGMSCS